MRTKDSDDQAFSRVKRSRRTGDPESLHSKPEDDALATLQRTLGNRALDSWMHSRAQVQRDFDRREPDDGVHRVMGKFQGPARVPPHVRSAVSGTADDRMRAELTSFRKVHDSESLSKVHQRLGEQSVPITRDAPATTLRRAGRDSSESDRERYMRQAQELGNDEFVGEIFNFFYPSLRAPDTSTDAAHRLAADMMAAAIRGSRMMDWVPRPPSRPTPTWLFTQVVKAAWRAGRDQGIYVAIRNDVARNFRGAFDVLRGTGEYYGAMGGGRGVD